jgi:uncharacterized membrane protein
VIPWVEVETFLNEKLKMKNYEITLESGKQTIVLGAILTQCEATGQSFIYSEKDITWHNLIAVVPATALVRVLK